MADSQRARIGNGKETPVPAGLMARLTGMIAGARAGFNGAWFPPGDPPPVIAPDPKAIQGRRFDYPAYANTQFTPRGSTPLSFAQLRRLAEPAEGGLDLLRLAIETRKDQMLAQKWEIRGRKKNDDGGDVARNIETQLRKPDGSNTFRQWLKMLLEDHFVTDAPAIYYRNTSAGMLLEIIDGATLTLQIDDKGRTPVPPLTAYEQIIHGAPATEYTTKELGYYMYNPRPNRIYGMSRVEQVVGIVTLALNRQLSVLEYYTSGSVPDMLMGVPDTWTVDQIKDFQTWWDSILSGQTGEKRKARFVPGGMEPHELKPDILKDEFDEWLARIICYAFSLSPQTLVKEVNRATAETAKEQSAEEGLEPTKLWVKDVMDDALLRMGQAGLEWAWNDEEIQDPKTKAEVVNLYTGSRPIMGYDSARKLVGLDAAEGEEKLLLEELWAPAPPPGLGPDGEPIDGSGDGSSDNPKDDAGDGSAAKRRGRSLPQPNARLFQRTESGIRGLVHSVLIEQRDAMLEALGARAQKRASPKVTDDDVADLLRTLDSRTWNDRARWKLRELLKRQAKERAAAALRYVKPGDATAEAMRQLLNQANERAVAWAESRTGGMITDVSNATRNAVNELTAAAIRDGRTNAELARQLEDAYEFSPGRAATIATTETAEAETQGSLSGYLAAGLAQVEWSADELACEECAAVDGEVVATGSMFSNGVTGPPGHPRCRCSLAPVVPE